MMDPLLHNEFPKIPRLRRECVISEKIDGQCAAICISDDGDRIMAGSRTRLIRPGEDDMNGFAQWVEDHRDELLTMGPGQHGGEWWGSGIAKRQAYGLPAGERRFSLFNTTRWGDERPACCHVVPLLYRGIFSTQAVEDALEDLRLHGSRASPGFMRPEGVVVFHFAANMGFKVTLEGDSEPKGSRQ